MYNYGKALFFFLGVNQLWMAILHSKLLVYQRVLWKSARPCSKASRDTRATAKHFEEAPRPHPGASRAWECTTTTALRRSTRRTTHQTTMWATRLRQARVGRDRNARCSMWHGNHPKPRWQRNKSGGEIANLEGEKKNSKKKLRNNFEQPQYDEVKTHYINHL